MELQLPDYAKRNLLKELTSLGNMTPQQILDWTEKLPIRIEEGISNTQVSIVQGVIKVEPSINSNTN